ncbi:MAG: 1-(5-phosphoribosyl)-5-[(5-phosphoribosylamino)methylideneamino]imidazole-4-carboxamide isomerase [Ruminococcaceae bacterium]|nr:1-(5-phosphoribosyl)-5-[(5-phosphoribosylamino)methylideneamino]imidazole-4-carboxamide isomerase [Oscillospiraceae bacterium]
MILFPAIDLYEGKAVRLFKGDYAQMTVYSHDPLQIARDFEAAGAAWVHLVDLEGAKDGTTPNLNVVRQIANETTLSAEIGGGIRNMETVRTYLENGVDRVILGTAAVNDEAFLKEAIAAYGSRIAVGVDVKDGFVAIKGWTENSAYSCFDFCRKMVDLGVQYLICTDISKDGAMQGTNRELYRELSETFPVNITASGGVSSLEDIQALRKLNLYGAIVGKAYYSGAITLKDALEAAK